MALPSIILMMNAWICTTSGNFMTDKTNPMSIGLELMWMQLHSWFLEKPQDIYYPWTRSFVHSLCLVYLAQFIWCTFFSSVICEHGQVDGLQFDELELRHSPLWTATLVVSLSGLF
jgi:hypothetical protein